MRIAFGYSVACATTRGDPHAPRQESLRAFGIAEAAHASLAFARRLMSVFGPVIDPRAGFDEDVP
jgi:hypothetical protein